MEKLLQVWLRLLEERGEAYMIYDKSPSMLDGHRKQYEENQDPIHLMRAFNFAVDYKFPVPQWVIDGLDAEERLQKYRLLPPQSEGIEWLDSDQVVTRLGITKLTLASHISNQDIGYYIESGKWLSGIAQAVRAKAKVNYDGWTWVDQGEITFDKILENLDDLAFSVEEVAEFEKEHRVEIVSKAQKVNKSFPDLEKAENALCNTGQYWVFKYENKAVTLKETLGLRYIAVLIDNKGKELHITQLQEFAIGRNLLGAAEEEYRERISAMPKEELEEQEGLTKTIPLSDKLSEEDEPSLRNTVQYLYEQFLDAQKDGISETLDKKKQEWEKLRRLLSKEYGALTYVKDRRVYFKIFKAKNQGLENLRTLIQKDIRSTREKVKKDHPKLYQHLKDHIHTGEFCKYSLEPQQIDWYISI